jgi:hypothetical protein
MMLEAQMIQDPGQDRIHEVLDGRRLMIEGGAGGNDHRAIVRKDLLVLQVQGAHGRFPWDDDELAPLLQAHVRGPRQQAVPDAVGDLSQGAHGTGNHHHALVEIRTAGNRREKILIVVHAIGPGCRVRKAFIGAHLLAHVREHQVDLLAQIPQVGHEPIRVDGSGRSRHADDDAPHATLSPRSRCAKCRSRRESRSRP